MVRSGDPKLETMLRIQLGIRRHYDWLGRLLASDERLLPLDSLSLRGPNDFEM